MVINSNTIVQLFDLTCLSSRMGEDIVTDLEEHSVEADFMQPGDDDLISVVYTNSSPNGLIFHKVNRLQYFDLVNRTILWTSDYSCEETVFSADNAFSFCSWCEYKRTSRTKEVIYHVNVWMLELDTLWLAVK